MGYQEVVVDFPPGPLGVTFEWDQTTGHFVVADLPTLQGEDESHKAARNAVSRGDMLAAVNGVKLAGQSLEDVVDHVRNTEQSYRTLVFIRYPPDPIHLMGTKQMSDPPFSEHNSGRPLNPDTLMIKYQTTNGAAGSETKILGGTKASDVRGRRAPHTTSTSSMVINPGPGRVLTSPVQTRIEEALRGDHLLDCLAVRVVNESYWYKERRQLGPSKHMHHGVRFDRRRTAWEAYIYIYQINIETGRHEAVRRSLGWFPNEIKAAKKCEAAVRLRDSNPGELEGNPHRLKPEDLLATHFRVIVVSDSFNGKTNTERTCMVYEALLRKLHSPGDLPAGTPASVHATLRPVRGFSGAVGRNVLQLRIFRCLPLQVDLTIECRTPGQWHPEQFSPTETELFGESLIGHTALAASEGVGSDDSNTQRLKLLLFGSKKTRGGKLLLLHTSRSPKDKPIKVKDSELLGVVVEDEHEDRAKEGGIYGHFYKSMDSRRRVYEQGEYKKNVQRLRNAQKAQLAQDDDSNNTNMRGMTTAFKNDLGSDSRTKLSQDLEIISRYHWANRSIRGVVRRLQRLYRACLYQRAARRAFMMESAALKIQRCVRGHHARLYVRLLSTVVRVAAIKIQSAYRGMKARELARELARIIGGAVTVIAKWYRGHLARRYVAWIRMYEGAATRIETMVRGFLARCRFKKRRGAALMGKVFLPAAIVIQRHIRGYICRKKVKDYMFERLREVVVVPCATCIQRIYRAHRARKRIADLRRRWRMAIRMQCLIRGFLLRRQMRRVRERIHRHNMAICVQKVARGYMDRMIVRRRLEKRHKLQVVIPAAIKLQAHVRGFLTRAQVRERRRQWYAVLKLQTQFRCYRARNEMLERWREMSKRREERAAVLFQRMFRGFLGRRQARHLLLDLEGKRLHAARIIMRAFLRFQYGKRFRKLMDKWEVEESAKLLVDCAEEKLGLEEDMADIDTDIEQLRRFIRRYELRVNELKDFRREAQLRLPQVEVELDDLGVEDIEGGWGEALEAEWESLNNRLSMSAEELRQLKIQIRNCEDDIMKLKMEREDAEMDLERFHAREMAEYELLGRMEIERGDRRAKEDFRRQVYRQRCRWKDASTRRKVILRSLDYMPAMTTKVRAARALEVMGSVSSERQWDREDAENFMLKCMLQTERKRRAQEVNLAGFKSPALSATIDSVVSATLQVVKAASHPMRKPPRDIRTDERCLCHSCGKVFCKCPGSQCYNALRNLEDED